MNNNEKDTTKPEQVHNLEVSKEAIQEVKDMVFEAKNQIQEPKKEILDEKSLDSLEMVRHNYEKDNPKNKEVRKRIAKLYARRLAFIFLSALIFNFGVQVFLNRGETIPSGLSGAPLLINLIAPSTKPYFALIYLAFNLPLLLGFGFKIKKSFTLMTLAFMLFQILTNLILTSVPIGENKIVLDWLHEHINFAPGWTKEITVGSTALENPNSWPIFAYGAIGSGCAGTAIAIAWKNGGSTGGTDIVAYYFSTKRQKSVGNILSLISIIMTITFLIIFGFAQPHHNYAKISTNGAGVQIIEDSGNRVFFGMREFTTFFYILVVNFLINFIYPKYKKVAVEISCGPSPDLVLAYFKKINYWHGYTVVEGISGYSGLKTYRVVTTMLLLETRSIIRDLKTLDTKLWISVKPVIGILGSFSTKYVDEK